MAPVFAILAKNGTSGFGQCMILNVVGTMMAFHFVSILAFSEDVEN